MCDRQMYCMLAAVQRQTSDDLRYVAGAQHRISEHAVFNRQARRPTSNIETTLEGNPTWSHVEALQLRQINTATYSQLLASLADDEVLIARVGVSL